MARNPARGDGAGPETDVADGLDGLVDRVTTAGDDREPVAVEAPFTGEELGTVPQCEPPDVERAVRRARAAGRAWAERPASERAAAAMGVHDLALDRQAELLDLVQLEAGKARRDAHEELLDVANTARHYAVRAEGYLASERRGGALPAATRTEVHHHPRGVVGLITPWNYPLTLVLSDALPALLAGNAVVLKPAEDTPYAALYAKELLEEAGIPPECFQVVTGHGAPVGEALVANVDFLGFTGSTETGRTVARLAGEHLVDCSLELGGKNPGVVLADVDLDAAVEGLLRGAFANAGQLCIAIERLYVHEAVHDEFLERFVARAGDLTLGTTYDFDVEVGSLTSADQLDRVREHVDDARGSGATVETGGTHRPDVGPYVYEPTVLTGVESGTLPAEVETFGPVVAVEPVPDAEAAVERANDSTYGLNACVWTADAARGRRIAREIDCGTVGVNDPYPATFGSVDAPMGGMGDSGIGRRHGPEGLYKYTESQTVATQRWVPVGPAGGMDYESWARWMSRVLRAMKRIPGLR